MERVKLSRELLVSLVAELNLEEEAVKAAKEGTEWIYNGPDCVLDMVEDIYYCKDCECWHKIFIGNGFLLEDGRLYVTNIYCDNDGNWDYDFSGLEIQSMEEAIAATNVDYEAIEKHMKDYIAEVAETGDDPLEQIYVSYFVEEFCKVFKRFYKKHSQLSLNNLL